MGRGLMIALAASLAANVFLGGFAVGRLVGADPEPPHERADGPPPRAHGPRGGGDLLVEAASLSPEMRSALKTAARDRRGDFLRSRQENRRLRDQLAKALAADPFDRAEAEAALIALFEFNQAQQSARTGLLLDVFAELPAEERRALMRRIEEAGAARRERARRGESRHGGDDARHPERDR